MIKEKFHREYVFDKVSRRSLWNQLITPPGLSAWFADDVTIDDDIYTFIWDKTEQEAKMVEMKPEQSVRYRWVEDEEDHYFEFKIHVMELTGGTSLEVTDFALPDEQGDSISLWDTQIDELKRSLGI
jgi:uncharacterized protein YndB with AHSA1/START domain